MREVDNSTMGNLVDEAVRRMENVKAFSQADKNWLLAKLEEVKTNVFKLDLDNPSAYLFCQEAFICVRDHPTHAHRRIALLMLALGKFEEIPAYLNRLTGYSPLIAEWPLLIEQGTSPAWSAARSP